jgi:hypothetical protein
MVRQVIEQRIGAYALVSFARPAVGIKEFFVYWRAEPGGPHLKIGGPFRNIVFAHTEMLKHRRDNTVPEVVETFDWDASHTAILYLENRGFEMTAHGSWLLPKPKYQLNAKETSAIQYLVDQHSFLGVERHT